jgi:hypothetical protein
MKMIKTIVFFLSLSGLFVSAHAQWFELEKNNASVMFVDPSTKKRNGAIAQIWAVSDLKKVEKIQNSNVQSKRFLYQFNCKEDLFRYLSTSAHTGRMATGKTINNLDEFVNSWQYVPPATIHKTILDYACTLSNDDLKTMAIQEARERKKNELNNKARAEAFEKAKADAAKKAAADKALKDAFRSDALGTGGK